MTNAFNLSQFANKVNSSGKADLTSAVTGVLSAANGGTGLSSPGPAGNILQSNGTEWTSIPVGGYVGNKGQVFTSNGTFTIPSGVSAVKITAVGGGGAGGGVPGYSSNNGGNTTISSGTQAITTITAGGGSGAGGALWQYGGAGGVATNGSINIIGGDGTSVYPPPDATYAVGGTGGASSFGGGGRGGTHGGLGANNGKAYGSGGGGRGQDGQSGGGGAGATAISFLTGLTAGSTLTVTVGLGGLGQNGGGSGANGIVIFEW